MNWSQVGRIKHLIKLAVKGLLGFDPGDGGPLGAYIYANSVTVFLSHSEHNFLNDRLR